MPRLLLLPTITHPPSSSRFLFSLLRTSQELSPSSSYSTSQGRTDPITKPNKSRSSQHLSFQPTTPSFPLLHLFKSAQRTDRSARAGIYFLRSVSDHRARNTHSFQGEEGRTREKRKRSQELTSPTRPSFSYSPYILSSLRLRLPSPSFYPPHLPKADPIFPFISSFRHVLLNFSPPRARPLHLFYQRLICQ